MIGTPCQIFGARAIAEKRHRESDFLFVDFFCHGNASLLLWKRYLEFLRDKLGGKPEALSFRCKERGWHHYLMKAQRGDTVYYGDGMDDPFYALFLTDAAIQEDCFGCSLRFDRIFSDIRIGDFWGPSYQQNTTGVSVLVAQTEAGLSWIEALQKDGSMVLEPREFSELQQLKCGADRGKKPCPPYREKALAILENEGLDSAAAYVRQAAGRTSIKQKAGALLRKLGLRK